MVLESLVTTAAGVLLATVGVPVGGVVTRCAQDQQWIRDQPLAAYQELFSHYAKLTMELRRAHGDGRGWDYDWGEWSAALMRVMTSSEVVVTAPPKHPEGQECHRGYQRKVETGHDHEDGVRRVQQTGHLGADHLHAHE
ncbi:hypothetical protein [Streptomyces sp. NBC_01601]|uniref:hypothetical protein n=1 Tax=Streptomyces sp. NBC_01601 TaxID=2975892 RepID=UPI002E2C71F3|nr:hypothetical protein [Streptomyces sp. NBC_01601]